MVSLSASLRQAADRLEANALAQDRTSESSTGAVPIATAPGPLIAGLATQADIDAALKSMENPANALRRALPGAVGELERWAAELRGGATTEAELQGFKKYLQMVLVAGGLRATVQSAAEDGIAARNAGLETAASTASSIVLAAVDLPESGVGESAASLAARHGRVISDIELIGQAADGVVEAGAGLAAEGFLDRARIGVESGDPLAIRHAYEARADDFLSQNVGLFRSSSNASDMNVEFIRRNAINEFAGTYQVAVAQGQVADAFNLGPSWATSALSTGMDLIVPHSGTATFAVLGGAEASAHLAASATYLNVATDASMGQLIRTVEAMKL
jgi:hypothetical protein